MMYDFHFLSARHKQHPAIFHLTLSGSHDRGFPRYTRSQKPHAVLSSFWKTKRSATRRSPHASYKRSRKICKTTIQQKAHITTYAQDMDDAIETCRLYNKKSPQPKASIDSWSKWGESNPRISLGKAVFYHWTTFAFFSSDIIAYP